MMSPFLGIGFLQKAIACRHATPDDVVAAGVDPDELGVAALDSGALRVGHERAGVSFDAKMRL